MAVATRWYNDDKTVIITEFIGDWVWNGFEITRDNYRKMMDAVDHPIDQIYDLSKTTKIPSGLISRFWNVAASKHRNTSGIVIVIGRTRLGEILTNAVGKAIGVINSKFDISYITDRSRLDEHLEKRKIHVSNQSF